MNLVAEVVDYLSSNQNAKAKKLAADLGENRREINSLLHSTPNTFYKNADNQWSLIDTYQSKKSDETLSNEHIDHNTDAVVVVENLDLVERLKEKLQETPNLKSKKLSRSLNVSRQLVTRTLHSYQNVFIKGEDNSWTIKLNHIIEIDKDIAHLDTNNLKEPHLPSSIFVEQDKPAQQVVIEAKLDRNFLVLAPPGTGKTHTLIERLVFALTRYSQEVDAGKFLILSFTRAAVGEIRDRISNAISNGAPSSLRYVQVKTFDAYATWLLNDGGYDIAGKSYDARIQLLTDELRSVSLRQPTARIDRSRYLFIDEIQDLVGVRADMVFELVKRILACKGSVTLLGDPHQSLNDYQIKGEQTDSVAFLAKVQNHLSGGLERLELEGSHRYETPEMKTLAAEAKTILDNTGLTPTDKFKQLVNLIPEITQEKVMDNINNRSTNALLCRTNGEVFQWSNWLQKQGILSTVNAGSHNKPWPAWIGQAMMHYQSKFMTCEQLLKRLTSNVGNYIAPNEEELAKFLHNERLVKRNTINLEDLSFRLKYLSPTIKDDQTNDGLIGSTVHKAKGLEYKNVVVVEPRPNKAGITDEEVRVLYVAITRAKRSILLLPQKQIPFSGRIRRRKGGHLGCVEYGIKYLQIIGLEDFDLETLFFSKCGGVDNKNLENYLLTYQECNQYSIYPESCNTKNDHNYALFLNSSLGLIRLCAVGEKMKISLDAMSYGNKYGEDGVLLDLGQNFNYQTIVHPLESSILARHIGPAGIMVFPLINGFYPLSRAKGE